MCDQVFICRSGSVTDSHCLTLSQPPKSGQGKKSRCGRPCSRENGQKPFSALISDHDMAGSRTVQAARYSLCRPCCFPGGGYSVQTQELGPLCLKMPACQTFTFQTALQHACHTQRGCLQLFCYKINKMHVNTYIEFY